MASSLMSDGSELDVLLDVALAYVRRDFEPSLDPEDFDADVSASELAMALNILGEELEVGVAATRSFREQLERVASIIECSTDAIVAITEHGVVSTWNGAAEALFGYGAAEMVGVHISRLQSAGDPEELDWIDSLLGGETIRGLETVRWHKSGCPIDVSITMSPIRDAKGEVRGGVGFVRDIRERKRTEELRSRLAEARLRAQEEERRRVARELHDEAGQSLTALVAGLSSMEGAVDPELGGRVLQLRDLARSTLADLRRLAHGLHPATLDRLGLRTALERHVQEFGEAHGARVDMHVEESQAAEPLPAEAQIALYRIVQEALTNCGRHAQAKSISVVLHRKPESARIVVEDDGRGFEVGATRESIGLGLVSMHERVAALGGRVEIESAPGEGTTVMAEIPVGSGGRT